VNFDLTTDEAQWACIGLIIFAQFVTALVLFSVK
jgi:hypothetical protein